MPKLSVTLITRNEATNIAAALESVAWADEILVVDAESTDDTAAIATRHGAQVVVRPWIGYGEQKNHAASLARHDWILSIDADERVTPALAREIQQTLATEPALRGYRMPRVAYHLGRWIRTTDWYPDYKLRLYDRRVGRWDEDRLVHESVRIPGEVGTLASELEHYSYRDIADQVSRQDLYSSLGAQELHRKGIRASAHQLVLLPPFTFFRNYILKGGIRDGVPGFVISLLNAYYVLLKYTKLWEIDKGGGTRD